MCVAVGKYFPALGWVVAKNRDRNYDLGVSFDERTTEDGLDVLVYRDDVTGYTEGLNSNGVAVVSTALLVLDDEKEAEKERERKLSKDGQKLNQALEFATAREAARYLVEAELTGHTLVADRRHLYHLEADRNEGEYEWHLREVPHDETVAVTNHGLRFPEAGYQLPGEKGRSSRARLRVARRLVEEARSPRDLLDSLVGSYTSDPANNVARTATDSSKLRTTAQVLLVPSERTVYFRPVTSSLTFDYFKLQNPKSKVWLEVLNQRPLYEAHDAEANGKAKLKHRLRQAVKKAVAKGAEVSSDFSETSALGNFDRKAQTLALAKRALLEEFSSFTEDEKWEFTRCVRSDGSAYGSRGKCRKGTEQAKEKLPERTASALLSKAEEYDWETDPAFSDLHNFIVDVYTGDAPFDGETAYEALADGLNQKFPKLKLTGEELAKLDEKDEEIYYQIEGYADGNYGALPERDEDSDFSESTFDFTTCARSDGSLYGTAGKCRKGKEVSEDQAALQRKSNALRKSGRYGGTLKQRLANDLEHQHLSKQHKALEKRRGKTQAQLKKASEALEKDRWNTAKRDDYRKAESAANAAYTAAERVRSALKRRERELTRQHLEQNAAPRPKATKDLPDWAVEGKQLR